MERPHAPRTTWRRWRVQREHGTGGRPIKHPIVADHDACVRVASIVRVSETMQHVMGLRAAWKFGWRQRKHGTASRVTVVQSSAVEHAALADRHACRGIGPLFAAPKVEEHSLAPRASGTSGRRQRENHAKAWLSAAWYADTISTAENSGAVEGAATSDR